MTIWNMEITASESPLTVHIPLEGKYYAIKNTGDHDILVSSYVANPTEGADDVMKIPSGSAAVIPVKDGDLYVSAEEDGTYSVSIQDDKVLPWSGGTGSGGDGGGTLGLEEVVLWENEGTTNPQTITLSEAITNFDEVAFYLNTKIANYGTACNTYLADDIIVGSDNLYGAGLDMNHYVWYKTSSSTSLAFYVESSASYHTVLTKIIGRRYTRVNPTGYRRVTLWENEGTTNPDTIALSENITNFDEIKVIAHQNAVGDNLLETSFTVNEIGSHSIVLYSLLSNYGTYSLTNNTTLTKVWEDGSQGFYVYKIIGIKYGSGGGTLGALAYKDTASGSYTPAGSVSVAQSQATYVYDGTTGLTTYTEAGAPSATFTGTTENITVG